MNKSIGLSKHVGWQYGRDEATAARSRPSRRLNANANALDEKGKKYGSFNPTSVNSFCPVAEGGSYSLQVGDFQVAIGDTRQRAGSACPRPPEGLIENPNRPGSWGRYNEEGRFREEWRFDPGRPEVKRGHGSIDHIHLNGTNKWYPVR